MKTIEERLAALEGKVFGEAEPERDPYLVPGVPCEVWDDEDRKYLQYFSGYGKNGELLFRETWGPVCNGDPWLHYRVLSTVWDHLPPEAEWVATDKDGDHWAYVKRPAIQDDCGWEALGDCWSCGAADPADWENSLRRRPKWART